MPQVLVTGATGFVGRALCDALSVGAYDVRATIRRAEDAVRLPSGCEVARIEAVDAGTDWRSALRGVEALVHLAGRVHVMKESSADPLTEFRNVNVGGTLCLAKAAVASGVRRFIFVSTVKVNGEFTSSNRLLTAEDRPAPQDPYSASKYEAEVGLRRLAAETGMEVVIVRPPLVYGPQVKGNFLRFLRLVAQGIPLPFANVDNRRSLVEVRNLVSLVIRCMDHPAAAGETFLVSDGEDLSTGELVRLLAAGMGRKPRLFPVPLSLSRSVLKMMGREDLWQRLFGSLQVSCDKARDLLGWRPSVGVVQGLGEVGRWYADGRKSESQKHG